MKETSTDGVREGLVKMRANLLAQLVALARDRKEAELLREQINTADAALASIAPKVRPTKYSDHKSVILAIVDYLEEVDRPVGVDEIVSALAAGGFRSGNPKYLRTKVTQSINAGLTNKVKVVNGLVGLSDWPKARFTA